MFFRFSAVAVATLLVAAGSAQAQAQAQVQVRSLMQVPDSREDFVRLCAPHIAGRWANPETVCGCLHDQAAATVGDPDLRKALLRGIGETGVPTIETDWMPPSKRSEIGATFTRIAKPALQCMFEPLN